MKIDAKQIKNLPSGGGDALFGNKRYRVNGNNGNDTYNGIQKPFATINKASDASASGDRIIIEACGIPYNVKNIKWKPNRYYFQEFGAVIYDTSVYDLNNVILKATPENEVNFVPDDIFYWDGHGILISDNHAIFNGFPGISQTIPLCHLKGVKAETKNISTTTIRMSNGSTGLQKVMIDFDEILGKGPFVLMADGPGYYHIKRLISSSTVDDTFAIQLVTKANLIVDYLSSIKGGIRHDDDNANIVLGIVETGSGDIIRIINATNIGRVDISIRDYIYSNSVISGIFNSSSAQIYLKNADIRVPNGIALRANGGKIICTGIIKGGFNSGGTIYAEGGEIHFDGLNETAFGRAVHVHLPDAKVFIGGEINHTATDKSAIWKEADGPEQIFLESGLKIKTNGIFSVDAGAALSNQEITVFPGVTSNMNVSSKISTQKISTILVSTDVK